MDPLFRFPRLLLIKGELHLLPKISMFYALSQNKQQLFEKLILHLIKKMFKKLKNGIEILVGQAVLSYISKQSKCCFWINNSRTAWPTLILMLFLSSLDNLLIGAYIIFQKDVDNFEIEHKTC